MKYDLTWARDYRRYLVDPDLIGWLWPWEYRRILGVLRRDDPKWFERNQHRILPCEPMRRVEYLNPLAVEYLLI